MIKQKHVESNSSKTQHDFEIIMEFGHKARLKDAHTEDSQGRPITHDWVVWLRNPNDGRTEHFLDKVVFTLHKTFKNSVRMVTKPPFMVQDGYGGCFPILMDLYFKAAKDSNLETHLIELVLQPPKDQLDPDYKREHTLIRFEKMQFPIKDEDFKKHLLIKGRARMVVDFSQANDIEDLNNIVEFIEGKKEEKPRRKKKKRKTQTKDKLKKVQNIGEASQAEESKANLEPNPKNSDNSLNPKNMSVDVVEVKQELCLELETVLEFKTDLLNKNKSNLEQVIGVKSKEMKDLLIQISQVEDQNNIRGKRITSVDLEIDDLEARIVKLKEEKQIVEGEIDLAKSKVQKVINKKIKLENYIEIEMQKTKERENELKADIKDIEAKITALDVSGTKEKTEQDSKLLDFLTSSILEKINDLECPVCLETATIPIYSCPESHLICSSCRPKMVECPECRVEYGDVLRRHRYAEKTATELDRLKEERRKIL